MRGDQGDDEVNGGAGNNVLSGGPGNNSVVDNHRLVPFEQVVQSQKLAPAPTGRVPILTNVASNPNPVLSNNQVTISALGADGNGGALLRFEVWEFGQGGRLLGIDETAANGLSVTLDASVFGGPGVYKTISHVYGTNGEASNWVAHDIVVSAATARTPVITALDRAPNPVQQGQNLSLQARIDDPDHAVNSVQFIWDRDGSDSVTTGDSILGNGSALSAGVSTYTLPVTETYATGVQHFLVRARYGNNTQWTNVKAGAVEVDPPPNSAPAVTSLTPSGTPLVRGLTLTLTANVVAGQSPTTEVHFYWDSNGNGVLDPTIDTDLGHDSSSSGGWTLRFGTGNFPLGPNVFFARAEDGQAHNDYVIGTTTVTLTGPDTQTPTATLQSIPDISVPGGGTYGFQVRYDDDVAIDVRSLGDGNIRVNGPNDVYSQLATFVSVEDPTDGATRTATYSITPPGGSWDSADNGTYRIYMWNNQVSDTSAHFIPFGELGTFTVNIPDTTPPIVTLDGLSTDLNLPTVKNVSSFSVSGTASDAESGITSNRYHFFLNAYRNGAWGDIIDLGAGGPSTNLASLPDGLYALALQAENGVGLTAESSSGFFIIDTTAPTASVGAVSSPRTSAVSSLTITFSEPVTGFDKADLSLTRNGAAVALSGATLTSGDNVTWTLGNLANLTGTPGNYVFTLTAAASGITDVAGNALAGNAGTTWTVNSGQSSVTVNGSSASTVFGQPVTFTATVSGAGSVPTGTVTFFDGTSAISGAITLGSVSGNGVATFTTSNLATSSTPHSITAQYSGDTNYQGKTSSAITERVNQAGTGTVITESVSSPTVYGQLVTFTATVSVTSPGSGIPTGTVTFFAGSTPISAPLPLSVVNGNDVATWTPHFLGVGTSVITARYSGDANYLVSNSPSFTHVVNQAGTGTVITESVSSPTVYGQLVTFTATVGVISPGSSTPTGTVTFFAGTTPISAALPLGVVNGNTVATWTPRFLGVGTSVITARYSGDPNFQTSTSPSFTHVVNQAGTGTVITESVASPTVYGQLVTFTATVSVISPGSSTPTGTVTFFAGTTPISAALPLSVVNGNTVATWTPRFLGVGTSVITAQYSGDPSYQTSTSPSFSHVVNQAGTATVITESVSSPTIYGQLVTMTATVTATAASLGTPTGTVTFFAGTTPISAALPLSVVNGNVVATWTPRFFGVGTSVITARYNGDPNYLVSNSPTFTHVVNKAGTSITAASSSPSAPFGAAVTFTATVVPAAASSGTPTGTVTFKEGATVLGTVTLSGKTASLTLNTLAVGRHNITAIYNGDGNFLNSDNSAAPLVQTIA